MNTISSQTRLTSTAAPARRPQSAEPAQTGPVDSHEPGFARKAAGVVVATGAAGCGAVYGGVKGLYHGVRQAPATTCAGAHKGAAVLKPVGQVTGATVAAAAIGVTTIGGALATVGGGLVGGAAGATETAVARGPALIKGATTTAARAGVTAGSAVLGAVGGTLGALVGLCTLPTILYPPFGLKVIPQAVRGGAQVGFEAGQVAGRYVGGAIGGTAGALGGVLATAAVSVPSSVKGAVQGVKEGSVVLRNLPTIAHDTWNSGIETGGQITGTVGGAIGGVLGAGVAAVGIPVNGLSEAVGEGAQWANSAYNWTTGQKGE